MNREQTVLTMLYQIFNATCATDTVIHYYYMDTEKPIQVINVYTKLILEVNGFHGYCLLSNKHSVLTLVHSDTYTLTTRDTNKDL